MGRGNGIALDVAGKVIAVSAAIGHRMAVPTERVTVRMCSQPSPLDSRIVTPCRLWRSVRWPRPTPMKTGPLSRCGPLH
jgi:hypothetical protein